MLLTETEKAELKSLYHYALEHPLDVLKMAQIMASKTCKEDLTPYARLIGKYKVLFSINENDGRRARHLSMTAIDHVPTQEEIDSLRGIFEFHEGDVVRLEMSGNQHLFQPFK